MSSIFGSKTGMPATFNTMTTSLNTFERFNNNELNACYYRVKIPITKEGLLINIGPRNKHFEKFMPLYSCNFQGETHLHQMLQLIVMIVFNTHDWRQQKSCFKKGNECRFHLPQLPYCELTVQYNTENVEDIISGKSTENAAKWYFHDGQYTNVCSYDIQTERQSLDVFVNTNHPIVSTIFGYNSHVSMESINTLYYCTLYASKTNHEEEIYPYLKASEAVTARIN
jgi:hypothetical protein